MARTNKLYEKTRATTIAADDLLTIGQLQQYGEYKVKTITRANEALETVTYAQLEAKVTASTLVAGKWYKITNATTANFNLIVQAIAVNKIGCDAKDPLYPNDVVKYNFASNEVYEVEVNSYASFTKYSALTSVLKIGFGTSEIDLTSNTINLTSNREYYFNNTTLIHTDNTKSFISAVQKENFSIRGKLNIIGTRVNSADQNLTENGIVIDKCFSYIIENVTIQNCFGIGINFIASNTFGENRDKGIFNNLILKNNNYPIYLPAGTASEYNLFNNVIITEHSNPLLIEAGNNNFTNLNVLENQKGILLTGGTNHGHGIFSNCNINHNIDYNISILNVTNGYTFNNCHIYGEDLLGGGKISINNSSGILFNAGIINAVNEIIDGANSGAVMYSNNYFLLGSLVTFTGTGVSKLLLKNNFDDNGLSPLNN